MAEKVTIGNCELWHGDCREVLPLLPHSDLILTDPPYGIGASAGTGKYGRLKVEAGRDLGWDNDTPPQWLMLLMLEKAAHLIVFGGNYFSLPPSRNYLVWDKGAGFKGRDFAECEFAWCSWDGNAKVLTRDPLANRDYEHKVAPNTKACSGFGMGHEPCPEKRHGLRPVHGRRHDRRSGAEPGQAVHWG